MQLGLALLSKAGAGIPSWLIALFPAAIAAMVVKVLMRERRDRLRAEAEADAPPVPGQDAPAET